VGGLTTLDREALAAKLPEIIGLALAEDIADGDITTEATVEAGAIYEGRMIAKAAGVVAGLEIARRTFHCLDASVEFHALVEEGGTVTKGDLIAEVRGPGRALLTGERVALNFLQRMSGIATATRRYVDAVAGTNAKILDTRKTVPGLRLLDKWAVALGGGMNHRIGLYDMALIKDNHIVAAGGIRPAVERVRAADRRGRLVESPRIEVEVKNLDELREALSLNVDLIMLDNMTPEQMAEAVRIANGRIPLEASGNVSLETVRRIAETGVDYISVGKLTHSVEALDISFLLNEA
jgi:nicotinate-nucleotide pyrophosphorylase (carboxylating)